MAAATAARADSREDGVIKSYKMSAAKVYKGTLVAVNSSGYLVRISDAASLIYVGVALETVDNSGGSAGDKTCRVYKRGEFEFAYTGADATIAKVGQVVYAQTDQEVDEDATLTTNDYQVGVITEFVTAAKVRVRIDNYVK